MMADRRAMMQTAPEGNVGSPLGRRVGLAWLATIGVGATSTVLFGSGIDINLSADVEAVAHAMLDAEPRLRALAYSALLMFALDVFVSLGLFLLLKPVGLMLASWSLVVRILASALSALGAVFLMNGAEIASREAYEALADDSLRVLLSGLQATSNYTSFHLSLVLSSSAMVGFFWLFARSGHVPRLLAFWGVFASLFVAVAVVLRDFIPALGDTRITLAFMLSNLIALLGTSIYLAWKGGVPTTTS